MLPAPNPQSHAALVQEARSGSLTAFDCLVEDYQDALFDLAYAVLGNFHDAEDVAQEAFIQAWRNLKQLRDDEKFFGWLYRITQNLCKNFVTRSRQSTRRTVPLQLVAHSLRDPKASSEVTSKTKESLLQAINA